MKTIILITIVIGAAAGMAHDLCIAASMNQRAVIARQEQESVDLELASGADGFTDDQEDSE